MQIGGRALALARIARVVEARAVGVPGHASAGRAAVDARDRRAGFFAGGDFVDVHVAALAAALRERDRDQLAVERRDVEVDLGAARRVELIGVEDDALGCGIVGRLQRD